MAIASHDVEPRRAALLSLAVPCGLVVLAACAWGWWARDELARTASSGIQVESRIEPRLEAWGAAPRSEALRIALFGDSLLMARDRKRKGEAPPTVVPLGPTIAELLRQEGVENDLVTVAHVAFRPVHFYYLLDEVLAGRPDVAIVSLNLPVFSSGIRFGEGFGFKNLSRKLSWAQQRELRAVLEKEEISFFDPSVYALQERLGLLYVLDGVRQRSQEWIQRAAEWIEQTLRLRRAPPPKSRVEEARERYSVDPDHPMIETTRRLVERLREAGVRVLVYVAPIDVGRLRRLGVYDELALPERIEVLRIAIGATPDEFRDFHDLLRRDAFADHRNHLRPAGLLQLAERVAPEVPAPPSRP